MLVKFFAQLLLTFCYFVFLFLAFVVFFLLLPLGEIKMCISLRFTLGLIPTWAMKSDGNTPKIRVEWG